MARSFVDSVCITLQSGKGGNGAVSFLRERHRPKGGPDGGDGGRGGSLYIRVERNLNTLSHLAGVNEIKAEAGHNGRGNCCTGHDGKDKFVEVPPGTLVYDDENGALALDTVDMEEGECYLLLPGGRGGKGNHHFKGPKRQIPRFAQEGEDGREGYFRLELSLIADVGLVGFPNAGKSSLQSLITNSHPKVAPYPFTTKVPNLGVLRVYDKDVVIADIPGLLAGAASGVGLGLKFLNHIRRAAGLLYIVDLTDPNFLEAIDDLQAELRAYDPSLLEKKSAILANKIDLDGAAENLEALRQKYPDFHIVAASCVDPEYVHPLQQLLLGLKEELDAESS